MEINMKNKRAEISQETLDIIKRGSYTVDGKF